MAKIEVFKEIKEFEHLYRMQENDIDAYGMTAALAYQNYPLFDWTFNDKYDVDKMAMTVATSIRAMKEYAIGISTDKDASAIALLVPPNYKGTPVLPYMLRGGFKLLAKTSLPYYIRLASYELVAAKVREKHTNCKCWYFYNLTVKPECQGKGQATLLLKAIFDFMDNQKQDLYLETHKKENISLYEHYGFELLEETSIPKSNVVQYAMIRRYKEKE